MTIKDCKTVCTEIVDEFIQKKLINSKKRDDLIKKLQSGVMTPEEWTLLAELATEDTTNA